jgi:hypothetical protein
MPFLHLLMSAEVSGQFSSALSNFHSIRVQLARLWTGHRNWLFSSLTLPSQERKQWRSLQGEYFVLYIINIKIALKPLDGNRNVFPSFWFAYSRRA